MSHSRIRALVIYAMWGALMFGSTFFLKGLPNIHLLALFIIVTTRVYRRYALIPIYIYVFLEGLLQGFSLWWIPYLYVWTVLWALVMLIPRELPDRWAAVVYCALGFLHGLAFGVMWAPAQALFFGLSPEGTVAWIVSGLPFDAVHGVNNAVVCTLCVPLIRLVERLEKQN